MFTVNISYAVMSSSKHDPILKWPSQPSANAAPFWRVQWLELHGNALTGFFSFPLIFQECPQPLHLSLPLLSWEELWSRRTCGTLQVIPQHGYQICGKRNFFKKYFLWEKSQTYRKITGIVQWTPLLYPWPRSQVNNILPYLLNPALYIHVFADR